MDNLLLCQLFAVISASHPLVSKFSIAVHSPLTAAFLRNRAPEAAFAQLIALLFGPDKKVGMYHDRGNSGSLASFLVIVSKKYSSVDKRQAVELPYRQLVRQGGLLLRGIYTASPLFLISLIMSAITNCSIFVKLLSTTLFMVSRIRFFVFSVDLA